MKKIIFIIALLWSTPSFSQIKSATLTASGLTCSMCSRAIYKALLKIPSIKSVEANVETSAYSIVFKPGVPVVLDEVRNAVEQAGFSVASMRVTATFDKAEVFNDAHITLGGTTFHFMNVPKQLLQGEKTITLVDKKFMPANEHKKFGKYTSMKCFETGMMEACCPNDHSPAKRIYHVTI